MCVREFVIEIRTNKGDRKWRHAHELSLVTCVSETSNNRWFEATLTEVSARRDLEKMSLLSETKQYRA